MMHDPAVRIDSERDRTFATLQGATDYAVSRAHIGRPVVVIDSNGAEYVIIKRDPAYTITMTRVV